MKHAGKAWMAGMKVISSATVIVISVIAIWSFLAGRFVPIIGFSLLGVLLLFVGFSLSFFRDPEARVPSDPSAIVSPGHGTVDLIDEAEEPEFLRGRCRRISIFLSVFDVHVQNAPISGRVSYLKHSPGQFLNAMRTDCGLHNENVLVGIESSEAAGERVAVRWIAGLIARRIVPWITPGDLITKGERTSLIQFGSRVDLYLPLSTVIQVKLGEKVMGGESIVAKRG